MSTQKNTPDFRQHAGFTDGNGELVTVGTQVITRKQQMMVGEVIDVTQDGDVTIEWPTGYIENTKWNNVCKVKYN